MSSRSSIVFLTQRLAWVAPLALAAALVACKKQESGASSASSSNGATGAGAGASASLPAGFVLAAAPVGEASPVAAVKASAKEGDAVTIRGVIGGGAEPMAKERALFTIVDPAVPSCAAMEEDHCPTPWDYCCEDSKSLVANSATVQVLGADGRPLALDLAQIEGVRPLSEVIVTGVVGPRPSPEVLVIHATGLHVAHAAGG